MVSPFHWHSFVSFRTSLCSDMFFSNHVWYKGIVICPVYYPSILPSYEIEWHLLPCAIVQNHLAYTLSNLPFFPKICNCKCVRYLSGCSWLILLVKGWVGEWWNCQGSSSTWSCGRGWSSRRFKGKCKHLFWVTKDEMSCLLCTNI